GPIAEMINEDLIAQFLKRLPEREQKVLKMRFGLEDGERKTLREIGDVLDVTRERIRQLEIDAIKRLRALYDEMGEFQLDQPISQKTAA
ncbi:sigma-70 family RNA polymerase sigma factor, partial [Candidatus Poribacteria bacterium]|nr:sigma-70 family RNA polymerase sigma factor [Candidatus Poribacteria bacterium]